MTNIMQEYPDCTDQDWLQNVRKWKWVDVKEQWGIGSLNHCVICVGINDSFIVFVHRLLPFESVTKEWLHFRHPAFTQYDGAIIKEKNNEEAKIHLFSHVVYASHLCRHSVLTSEANRSFRHVFLNDFTRKLLFYQIEKNQDVETELPTTRFSTCELILEFRSFI